jgi:peptidyl-prolyl cis-trans isomerase SurA
MNLLYAGIIFILSIFLPTESYCEVVDRIVAIVNDDIITLTDVQKYVRVEKEGRFVSVEEYFRNIRLRERVDTFIDDMLIKQQAKKLRIDVTDKEAENVIENIKRQYLITESELRDQLAKENISYKDFLQGIRMNLLRGKVLARVISLEVPVTDRDLQDYYNKHADEFKEEQYKLQQIFVSGKRDDAQTRAMTAYQLLREGKSFESVARSLSDDPSANQGGDIGFVKREDLIPELYQALSLLMPGMHTQVIQTPYGLHILRLVEVKKGESMTFESVKGRVHSKIVQQESEKRYKEYIAKLRRSSYIEVKI